MPVVSAWSRRTAPAGTSALTLGQQVTYRLTATNTSDETIDNIVVADPMVEALGQSCTLGTTTLAANASTWCEVTYTVTQADIDARHVLNEATADGAWPDGTPVPQADAEKDDDTTAADGKLVIRKDALINGGAKSVAGVGDTLSYTITATNTSGFTMTGVTLSDDMIGGLGVPAAPCSVGGQNVAFPLATLAPNGVITCQGSYTVTAVDVAAGHVLNIATGSANLPEDPDNPGVPVPADVTPGRKNVPAGGLEVIKTASTGATKPGVGDVVTYTITVKNTSNFPMVNVRVTGSLLDAAGVTLDCQGGNGRDLAAHASFSCTATYRVRQADVDAGRVLNTATAGGDWAPRPDDVPDSAWPTGPVTPTAGTVITPTQAVSSTRLPITGAEVAAWAGLAAALFTAGGALLVWRRRVAKRKVHQY